MKIADTTSRLFTEVGLRLKTRLQKAIPMPFSQYQTLSFVAEKERVSMQQVALHFKIRAPSATFLVEELVRGGLVERHTNTKDRRKVEVTLSAKGKRVFKTIHEKRDTILAKLFGSLEEKDRQDLNRILEKIINHS